MILNRRIDLPRPRQVYIGRPSKWGNHFKLTAGASRVRVIALYRADLVHRLRTGRVTRAELTELHGRPLVCWCAPLTCHGHVLQAAAAWAATEPDIGLEAAGWTREPIERIVRCTTRPRSTIGMTPLDLITRRQYLEEELALTAATHQYVLDGPTPTKPADRDDRDALLDRLRARWTNTLDCLRRHTDPARGGDPEWQGPVKERARHAAGRFAGPADAGAAQTAAAGAAEAALRAAVQRAERALRGDEGCYSVSRTHDTALDLTEAARAVLNELETRHTK